MYGVLQSIIESNTKLIVPVSILIPAYNEENCIADTLSSIVNQSVMPESLIVIDDCSTDRTAEIASSLGATVIRTPSNSGSKARALNYGLGFVNSEYTLTIDADMSPSRTGLADMYQFMNADKTISVASSFILPKQTRSVWERSRFVEYMLSFPFFQESTE
jgi:glycosyltransferase involved in cell wall biosynthesis